MKGELLESVPPPQYVPFYGEVHHTVARGTKWTRVVAVEFTEDGMYYVAIAGARIKALDVLGVLALGTRRS